ncbi:MAG: FtsX-like permease family protein, partial [Dehalococcoidia bacterium]
GSWMPTSQESMGEDMAIEISSMDDVAAVVPSVTQGFGEAETDGRPGMGGGMGGSFGRGAAYVVHGVPLDPELDEQYHVLPVSIVEGRSLEEDDSYSVLIGEELTDYFGAGVGETIDIEGTSFEVVGLYSSTMMENQVYMSLSTAQDLLNMEGELSMLMVYAESSSYVDAVAEAIESEYPYFMVMAMSDMQSQFGDVIQREQQGILSSLDQDLSYIQSLGLGITLVSGIIGVLLIFGLMFYTVRGRIKEIGTLKALGFSNPDIMKQFMYEGLYIGLIGGVIGLAVATVAASLFSSWLLNPSETLDVSVGITLGSMLLGLGLAVIAGALGSLYPAWRASRISPMEALRRE